jgi:Cu(I)/Ag(I) efflux system membrane fusion protein
MVVTSGEFLLDSEARLREALAKMLKGTTAAEQKVRAAPAGPSTLESLPDPAAKALTAVLDAYFDIGGKLASDTVGGLSAPARAMAESVDALIKVEIPEAPHFWHEHAEVAQIRGKALELVDVKDLEQARQRFADLSIALDKLVLASGVPPAYAKTVEQLHCPMYREGQGGTVWLQQAGEVRNPYYGKTMLGCFDTRFSLPITGAKPAVTAPPSRPRPAPPAAPGKMPPMPGM